MNRTTQQLFHLTHQKFIMAQHTYPGHCLVGDTETTKRKVKNEVVRQLRQERGPDPGAESWLLLFQGKYQPGYWIILLAKKNAALEAIDEELRYVWLECCGHLSAFTIYGEDYQSSPDSEIGEKGLNVRLEKLFSVGLTGEYIYDYGDSTNLTFKVLDLVPYAPAGGRSVELVAQNDPPDIRCSACGEPATVICLECLYESPEDAYLCDDCFAEHECDEDMSLPVVNSPRMGQCAYTG